MWSKCMRLVKIRMSIREFHQLPRHPAYKYEYIDGETWLTPRPKTYHALLDLRAADDSADADGVTTRPLEADDWDALTNLFSAAFGDRPPFLGLGDRKRRAAARAILDRCHTGGDGPLIEQASLLASMDSFKGPGRGASSSHCCPRPTSTTGGPSSGASRRRPTPWPAAWAGRT